MFLNNAEEWNNYCLETLEMTFDELLALPGHKIEFPVEFKKYETMVEVEFPTGKIELFHHF